MSFNNIDRNDKNWKPNQADTINNIINKITETINNLDVTDIDYKSKCSEIIVNGASSNNSLLIDNTYNISFTFTDYKLVNIPILKGCIFNVIIKAWNDNGQYQVFSLKNGKLVQLSDYDADAPFHCKFTIVQ